MRIQRVRQSISFTYQTAREKAEQTEAMRTLLLKICLWAKMQAF